MKRVKRDSLTLPTSSFKVAYLSPKGALLGLWFLPGGKVRACERAPSFLSCAGHCRRGPSRSCPTESTVMSCMSGRHGADDRRAARAPVITLSPCQVSRGWVLKGHRRDAEPTNHFTDAIRKPANEPAAGALHESISPAGPWVPLMLCTPHPHTHITVAPCVHPWQRPELDFAEG